MKRKHYTHAQRRHWKRIQRIARYDMECALRLAWRFGRALADNHAKPRRERRAA